MSQVSLGRPEFVPGTPSGHPTAKFLYVIFLYRFFSLHKTRNKDPNEFCDAIATSIAIEKCLKPRCSGLLKIFHRPFFTKGVFSKVFHRPEICTKKSFFSPRGSAGGRHGSNKVRKMRMTWSKLWLLSMPMRLPRHLQPPYIAELEQGERSAEGDLQCTLHFRGPQKIGDQISDIFRNPCFTVFDVQDVRNTISDNFCILLKIFRKFPHCGGPSEA